MSLPKIAGAIAVALLTANCATVTRGTTDQIQIVTEPSEASVKTSLGHACQSPCTLSVDRKAEFTVTAAKEGYKEASVSVSTRVAGAGAAGFAGNVLIGGVVGMGVDAATGATLEHFPNPVSINLEPLQPAKPARKPRKPVTPVKPKDATS